MEVTEISQDQASASFNNMTESSQKVQTENTANNEAMSRPSEPAAIAAKSQEMGTYFKQNVKPVGSSEPFTSEKLSSSTPEMESISRDESSEKSMKIEMQSK